MPCVLKEIIGPLFCTIPHPVRLGINEKKDVLGLAMVGKINSL